MREYDLVAIFKALSDKTRQDIMELLSKEERNVSDICAEFKTTQPTISHHLQILRNCNLISCRKEGKSIYYYVKQEVVDEVFGRVVRRKMRVRIVKMGSDLDIDKK